MELKPKSFMVKVPQQLYLVLNCLSDIEGHDSVRMHVATLISQYCTSKIIELRDDNDSTIHPIWDELFAQDMDDEMIKDVCKL